MNASIRQENNFLPQAYYLYGHTISCAFLTAALMIVVSIVIWDNADHHLVLAWLGLGLVNFIGRFFFHLYIERNYKTVESELLSKFFILMSSFYTGLIWCCCAIFFISSENTEIIIFLVASIFGVISTMLPVLSAYLPSFYVFSMPIFLSLIYKFNEIGMISPAISIALCIFTSFTISLHCHRSIIQNIEIAKKSKKMVSQQIKKRHIAERKSKKAISENIRKSKFMGTASHDLQQPLHAMGLCLEALELNLSNPQQGKIILDQLRLCHENFIDMFSSTMEFSSLDFSHDVINKSAFNIDNIISPLIKEFEIEASKKDIILIYKPTELVAFSEVNLIRRLIRNLLSNAVKFTESGSVHIEAGIISKKIQLTITDQGIGMSKENLSSIFDFNIQLNNPDKNLKNGSGLGLAIVNKINTLLNLKLSVTSKKGKGTQFKLQLPIAKDSQPLVAQRILPITNKAKTKILIIEHNIAALAHLTDMVKKANCHPLSASSLQQAHDMIAASDVAPDLILSNYCLNNDDNGVDAIANMRTHIGRDIPAIIMTDDTCSALAKRIRGLDFMIMYQPISMGVLSNALNRCELA